LDHTAEDKVLLAWTEEGTKSPSLEIIRMMVTETIGQNSGPTNCDVGKVKVGFEDTKTKGD
jgi:hypothetical protein